MPPSPATSTRAGWPVRSAGTRPWLTARWQKEFDQPQRLLVKISDDDGSTWRELWHGDPQFFGGVWSLAVIVEGGRTVFQLGLYKGGVMRLELP